jgi:hypothetical protein
MGKKTTLTEKFDHLMADEEIENELAALKSKHKTEDPEIPA